MRYGHLVAILTLLVLTHCNKKACRPGFIVVKVDGVEVCQDPDYEAQKAIAAKADLERLPFMMPNRPPLPPPEVAATKLWQDYESNEIAADAAYKDKRLSIVGVVDSVERDLSGKPYLYLRSTDAMRFDEYPCASVSTRRHALSTSRKGKSSRPFVLVSASPSAALILWTVRRFRSLRARFPSALARASTKQRDRH